MNADTYYRDIGSVLERAVEADKRKQSQAAGCEPLKMNYPWFPAMCIPFGEFMNYGADKDNVFLSGFGLEDRVACVFWQERAISVFETRADIDAVSFNFAGCYMAKFILDGRCYIAHIHSANGSDDRKGLWIALAQRAGRRMQVKALFQPFEIRDAQRYAAWSDYPVFGVITRDDECYEVVVDPDTGRAQHVMRRENLKILLNPS